MAGLVPAIHVFLFVVAKTWMPGTRPGMTRMKACPSSARRDETQVPRTDRRYTNPTTEYAFAI
jgi:hypothetical protein